MCERPGVPTLPGHERSRLFAHRRGALAAAAPLYVLDAVLQVADEQSSQTTVVGVEHVTRATLTAIALLMIPVTLHLGARVGRSAVARIPATGMAVLAALTMVSNVRGEDPSFFAAVAVPTNLMWFGGWVALAVLARRADVLSRPLAI